MSAGTTFVPTTSTNAILLLIVALTLGGKYIGGAQSYFRCHYAIEYQRNRPIHNHCMLGNIYWDCMPVVAAS